jgi:peptidoglycan/LPS O-acetylase OafA/YrhL
VCISAYAADVRKMAAPLIASVAPLSVLTYSIYMLHGIYSMFVFHFAAFYLRSSLPLCIVFIVVSYFVLLALAYFSYIYFEGPARRWISSLGGAKKGVTSEKNFIKVG